jgi:serine/threonine-protein kinase
VVGAGASAMTWRAHDRRLDRAVAIKVLRRDGDQDPNYAQRFEREARISASISDANVVQVFDVGQQDGWLYLVMQFVDGEDLKHLIARQGPLPAQRARDITLQMLDGLGAIHRTGILHRDIKSQNVLIDRNGKVVASYGSRTTPTDPAFVAKVESLIAAPAPAAAPAKKG